jgi:hypothetical protein
MSNRDPHERHSTKVYSSGHWQYSSALSSLESTGPDTNVSLSLVKLHPSILLQRVLVSSSTSTSLESSVEYPTRISQAMAKSDLQHEVQSDMRNHGN